MITTRYSHSGITAALVQIVKHKRTLVKCKEENLDSKGRRGKHYISPLNSILCLLFISYKFVKGFLAITFLFLVISSWNLHGMGQRFLCSQKPNFSWTWKKTKNFPLDPNCKNRSLLLRHVYRHDVTKVGDFYNGGLWENLSFFVGSNCNLFLVT